MQKKIIFFNAKIMHQTLIFAQKSEEVWVQKA